MTKEQDEERREATRYRIRRDFGPKSDVYRIDKICCETEVDMYHVTIRVSSAGDPDLDYLWCDCPGFRRQTYAKDQHKHVLLAQDYISRSRPEWAEYTIVGTGRNAKIKFLRSSDEEG